MKQWNGLCPDFALHCNENVPLGRDIAIFVQSIKTEQFYRGATSSLIDSAYMIASSEGAILKKS